MAAASYKQKNNILVDFFKFNILNFVHYSTAVCYSISPADMYTRKLTIKKC